MLNTVRIGTDDSTAASHGSASASPAGVREPRLQDAGRASEAGPEDEGFLRLVGLQKSYGATAAVRNVSLSIRRGELVGLLGPSGCGKTTTLNMIAGFVLPDSGRIVLNGNDVSSTPIRRRNVGFVFQNHALFPHMTVFENLAYGLRRRRVPKPDIEQRVREALASVGLEDKARQRPAQLSGGQQQRVALARALVIRPEILLLDEPLSSLDAKLRIEMRSEVRSIVDQANVTALFVTHDQEEAMAIADRIVVMNDGDVMQVGTPRELYEAPETRFVGKFIGSSVSLFGTVIGRADDGATMELGDGSRIEGVAVDEGIAVGAVAEAIVRPENITVGECDQPAAGNTVSARLRSAVFLGRMSHLQFDEPLALSLTVETAVRVAPGDRYGLSWHRDSTHIFVADG